MTYPVYSYGGNGPLINVALANGFPPATYRLLVDPLTERYTVVSLLPRALWPDPGSPEDLTSWQQMADDLLAGLQAHQMTDVIAVGHSMGGVASLLAVLAEPQRFKGLILLDPTFLPRRIIAIMRAMRFFRLDARLPLVQKALHRRAHFHSQDEAFNYWRQKALFKDWSDEMLRLYTVSMTRLSADGSYYELTWAPEWESRYYQTAMVNIWREVHRVRDLLPVLVIGGETTNTFTATSLHTMRRLLPEATYHTLPGHGHLFPQSAPDAARSLIETWLAQIYKPADNGGG